jgi:para-nitrobenzyl esterase
VENGVLQGIPAADPRITSFKGVPFAAPPTGDLRWKAPQPAKDWEGVLEAYDFAPISMQMKPGLDKDNIYSREWNIDPDIPMSEDCLYLNVWTPAKSADKKLPVFVWYFGGGLQVGNTAEMEFDGERIARRGIVVVTVNYRVNVFGFLAHPELTREAPDAPTNFGHLDQQFGTRWVKRNISAFGGDPDNITIGGQSAGAMSVNAQLVSPQNEGLFQKAIMDSGFFMSPYGRVAMQFCMEEAEEKGLDFFSFLGVETLAEARKLDATFIRDKSLEYKKVWGSVVDGKFLEGFYYKEIFRKRWPVPLLYGRTNNEFMFGPSLDAEDTLDGPSFTPIGTIDDFKMLADKSFGTRSGEFLELCHADRGLEAANKNATVSELEVACRSLAAAEGRAGSKVPVYYYVFGPSMPGWDNPGAFHSSDLWFWFETLAKCWRPFKGKHYDLARIMCNYWSNFIKTGDPNGDDADGTPMPRWNPYTGKEPYAIFLSEEKGETGMLKEGPDEMMEFLMDAMIENGKR